MDKSYFVKSQYKSHKKWQRQVGLHIHSSRQRFKGFLIPERDDAVRHTSAVLSAVTKIVADIFGLPESFVVVVLKGSVRIAFGGSQEPAACGELATISGLNPDVNKKLSARIAQVLEDNLSVPKTRFFLKFYESKGSNFAWNGFTLDCLELQDNEARFISK